jgi:peptide subunit release factor 1 (eRF1)
MYAVGVSRGEELIDSKVGTGLIHSRHRQGGSSANRFRRRRVDQIDHFLGRVCEKVKDHIGTHFEDIEFLAYGGAWTTIELLKKACPILSRLEEHQLPPLLDIGEPKQAVLEASVRRVWSSRVMEWQKEEFVP